jgi:hypothetical protein
MRMDNQEERVWQYNSNGVVKCIKEEDKLYPECQWNGESLIPKKEDIGFGRWDSVRLGWFSSEKKPFFPFNYFCAEDRSYYNLEEGEESFEWMGSTLRIRGKDNREWSLEGDVPEPVVVLLEVLHLVVHSAGKKVSSESQGSSFFIESYDL